MGIKLSAEPVQASSAERLRVGFIFILGGLLTLLKRGVLPHLLLSIGLWLLTVFAVYRIYPFEQSISAVLFWIWFIVLVILGSSLALVYALLTSIFWALKHAAAYAEDFFYELFETLKNKIRSQINSMEEGIAKQQAKVMLDNSVREILSPLKKLRIGSVPAILGAVLLAVLTFISRSVFLARLARISGATVNFSTIFASRATLVGALFLNMRWLATLILWLLYGVGLLVLILDIWAVL